MRAAAVAFLLFLSCVPTLGCDSFDIGGARHATLTYTEDARAAYGEAMAAYRNKDWEDAKALFGEVRQRFAYSRYARLAELRLADIEFEQDKFSDAIQSYREYVQNHRADRDVEYARYRISKSLFKDVDETIFLPPTEERDQATILDAYKELKNFLKDFPQSPYRSDVQYMFQVTLGRLARHELYVAHYYLRQDDFDATVARVDYALTNFAGSGLDPEALVLKGETLMKMKRLKDAREIFERVKREFGGPFAVVSQNFIAEINLRERHPKP